MANGDLRAVAVDIRGQVQGVGFRYSAVRRADELNLRGWVRNTSSGSVEALIIGPEHSVDEMLAWCETGPPAARVSSVQAAEQDPADVGDIQGFTVRR